jgi:hypothetical protein
LAVFFPYNIFDWHLISCLFVLADELQYTFPDLVTDAANRAAVILCAGRVLKVPLLPPDRSRKDRACVFMPAVAK